MRLLRLEFAILATAAELHGRFVEGISAEGHRERMVKPLATMLLSTIGPPERRSYRSAVAQEVGIGSLDAGSSSFVLNTSGRRSLPHHRKIIMSEPKNSAENNVLEKIRSNIMEGDVGTRGEQYFLGQVFLVVIICFAPYFLPIISAVTLPLGIVGFIFGLFLMYTGAFALGDSLTPWPKPCEENALATNGPFAICRHPIYSGLLSATAGLSLLTSSFERCAATLALFALLNVKANEEEKMLRKLHGVEYDAYAEKVPRLVPTSEGLRQGLTMLKDEIR